MREISITEFEGLKIGQAEDTEGGTGCTVFLFPEGAPAGLDVRGGGPASRESELLKPTASAKFIHAVVLAGGSAFGLGAADGVMDCLEEHDIGFDVSVTKVPLVCQSDLFDLTVGDCRARPNRAMGYTACKAALDGGNYQDGNFGAGTGASVGKFCGMERCMKSGIGSYAVQLGDWKIGAVVAVNALGDVFHPDTGRQIAGLLTEEKTSLTSTTEEMKKKVAAVENRFVGNTTIGAVFTNGAFDKTQLCKIAAMGQNGLARAISPVHTSADGDSLYAVSLGQVNADPDLAGTLAAEVVSRAILRAVETAESAYGFPCKTELFG